MRIDENKDFFIMLEKASRACGIVEALRMIPFDLQLYKLRLPLDLSESHGISIRNLWDRVNGTPRNELKDASLELSSIGRRYLIEAASLQNKLPKTSDCGFWYKALLSLTETELYFEKLEKVDFNVFHRSMRSVTGPRLTYRLFKANRSKKPILYL